MTADFASWLLCPRFSVSLFSPSLLVSNAKDSVLIYLSLPSENTDSLPVLPARTLVPLPEKADSYSFVLPVDEPGSLHMHPPGTEHVASHFGAVVAAQILGFFSSFPCVKTVFLDFSAGVAKIIESGQADFIVGLLQKSITNKVRNQAQSRTRRLFSVCFPETFFSDEHLCRGQRMSEAMAYTRTLVNMPANSLTPESYEGILRQLVTAQPCGSGVSAHIDLQVFQAEELEKMGCGLLSAVGKGSQVKPRLLRLTSRPFAGVQKHVALVGKGVTFDSGGYDLKPSAGMRNMKKDMGGSAAAFGAFWAIVHLGLPVKVTCWLPVVENMVSGESMRPGDIYTARNGLHVEIDNTDAEGRLILADALCLACEENPDWLIDIATLTGAARVSLGPLVDSLFGSSEPLLQLLYECGVKTGDWVWPLPLVKDYESALDSSVADIANCSSSGFAGSVTAALFLRKFVTLQNWSHIDTYMWCEKPGGLWLEVGPTAKCVRLLAKAVERFVAEK